MAEDILAFQAGREAAINGRPRDARRNADWLEGHDIETDTQNNHAIARRIYQENCQRKSRPEPTEWR